MLYTLCAAEVALNTLDIGLTNKQIKGRVVDKGYDPILQMFSWM